MESINISKRKYANLKKLKLAEGVISTEASFYKLLYMNKVKVFKNLHKTSGKVFANKLFTLTMLDEYRDILPDSFVIPEALCSVEKEIKGFILPYIKGITLESYLNDKNVDTKDKLYYIKKIGDILDKLEHIRNNSVLDSIYINDLHASNFIVEPKKKDIKVIDLDSSRICDAKPFSARYLTPLSLFNEFPCKNKYDIYIKDDPKMEGMSVLDMMKYADYEVYYCKYNNYRDELGYVNSNRESDLYCYTILFLNYLYGENVGSFTLEEFYNYMYYLEKLGFDRELLNVIYLIVSSAPNENIGNFLDSVTEEQVKKASKDEYKKYLIKY